MCASDLRTISHVYVPKLVMSFNICVDTSDIFRYSNDMFLGCFCYICAFIEVSLLLLMTWHYYKHPTRYWQNTSIGKIYVCQRAWKTFEFFTVKSRDIIQYFDISDPRTSNIGDISPHPPGRDRHPCLFRQFKQLVHRYWVNGPDWLPIIQV